MVARSLKQFFDPIINLDIQVWQNFTALGEKKSFPGETVLKQSNTTENFMTFLLEGSGGNLIWNNNNFVCTDISFRNELLNDYVSFTLRKPSPIQVRLFEDSKIFRISHQEFQKIFDKGNYGEKVTRLVLESVYIHKRQQQIDLLTKTAKERYLEFSAQKKLAAGIPLKYMASYLGITPQSLSRIRSEKTKN